MAVSKRVVLSTDSQKARGLIGMKPIPRDTAFVFTGVRPGQVFHSRGVLEPFEIAFFDAEGRKLSEKTVFPEKGAAQAPPGTSKVVEAAHGVPPVDPKDRPRPKGGAIRQKTSLGQEPDVLPTIAPIGFIVVGVGLGMVSYGLTKRDNTREIGVLGFGLAGAAVIVGIIHLGKKS